MKTRKILYSSVLAIVACSLGVQQFVTRYFKESVELFNKKKYQEALVRFEKLQSLDPLLESGPTKYILSIYINTGKFSKAGPLAIEMIQLDPHNLFAAKALVISFIENKKLEEGLDFARKTLLQEGLEPDLADDLLKLCISAVKEKQTVEKSIEWFLRNRNLWKFPHSIRAVLSNIESLGKDTPFNDNVVELRKRLREIDPNDASNSISLARTLNHSTDTKLIQELYREALRLDPEQASYAEEYADFLVKNTNDKETARQLYQQALRQTPEALADLRLRLKEKLKGL